MKYLLDTNVVSEAIRARPAAVVMKWLDRLAQTDAAISTVTQAELAEGVAAVAESSRRQELVPWLEEVTQRFAGRVLPLGAHILVDWLKLSRSLASKGVSRKAPDLLIAATARIHDLVLVTRNVRDFADTGLVVYDPWEDRTHSMDQP